MGKLVIAPAFAQEQQNIDGRAQHLPIVQYMIDKVLAEGKFEFNYVTGAPHNYTDEQIDLVRQLYELSHLGSSFDHVFNIDFVRGNVTSANLQLKPEDIANLNYLFKAAVEKYKKHLTTHLSFIVLEQMNEDELREAIAFYKTEAGKKAAALSFWSNGTMQASTTRWSDAVISLIRVGLQTEEYANLPQNYDPYKDLAIDGTVKSN